MTTTEKTGSAVLADLLDRINERTATAGVIGMGYVGRPLALLHSERAFRVLGSTSPGRRSML